MKCSYCGSEELLEYCEEEFDEETWEDTYYPYLCGDCFKKLRFEDVKE